MTPGLTWAAGAITKNSCRSSHPASDTEEKRKEYCAVSFPTDTALAAAIQETSFRGPNEALGGWGRFVNLLTPSL